MGWGARGRGLPWPAGSTGPLCPQLEQGLCCGQVEPLQGPVGDILECLVLPDRTLVEELAGPIAYLLEALAGEGPRAGQVGSWWAPQRGFLEPLLSRVSPQR